MATEVVADVEVVKNVEEDPVKRQLETINELILQLTCLTKTLALEMKTFSKEVNKMKTSKGGKRVKKEVDPNVPRKLGALEKPIPLTDELSEFLGLTVGEHHSRQYVTKAINAYVKAHDLQNPENRRYILLESDAGLKLKALLRDPDQPLTFFNIQRYLKVHYPKVEDSAALEGDVKKSEPILDASVTTPKKVVDDVDAVADDVDESSTEAPKKKVVRRVVKKTPA